jgi:hypothetical protein
MNTLVITDTLKMPDHSRRTFHVDVLLNVCDHRAYTVHTLDPLRAENVVRRMLMSAPSVEAFEFVMVREVIDSWNVGESAPGVTVRVPEWFQHRV